MKSQDDESEGKVKNKDACKSQGRQKMMYDAWASGVDAWEIDRWSIVFDGEIEATLLGHRGSDNYVRDIDVVEVCESNR